ncbi:GAF domain-containing protein [Micromonospora sp. WMMD882]|uniref:GAF domain-containing protein n=1 Tax=Micromonospora sp. WMMD882 TaxID=3015151 RepID=UPI00248BFD5D|nr:GAF domain-containing protein [Micromonospora sp. WMMD882]WBB78049.1 GAF domain-containing protein [Micromonospora sp. WMMD882]
MTAAADRRPTAARQAAGGPAADEDLRALFGQSIAVYASLAGPTHLLETANPAFFAAIGGGDRARTGVPIAELMPELAGQGFTALLDEVYRTGEAYTGRDARVVLGAGTQAREAFFDFTYEPRRDDHGDVTGIRVIGVETTQIKQAQRLLAEHGALLEQIARQAPLGEVLDGMARCIENLTPDVLVSVLLADADGRRLRHGAAPSLPDFYNEAIDGIATGEGVGSCGTAAHRREPVVVTDIATDPFWDDFRELAERAGLAACWSTPILARDGSLLGTFAMYHRGPRVPADTDLALARVFAGTAALAIECHHIEQARLAAEARAEAARAELAMAVRAERELRAEAEQRATAAAELADRLRAAAAAQAARPHPERCQLGGSAGCAAPAEIKIADSWGDSAWGCNAHVEEAILNVRSVFIASEDLGGLAAYLNR